MRRVTLLALGLLFLLGERGLAAPDGIVGKTAPGFSARQVSGEPLELSRFLGKTPVILTFWSIYCKSCTEEMEALQRLYEKFGKEKVTVIAVNEDGDVGLARVRNFLDRFASGERGRKLTFPILFDEKGEVYGKYSVVHLPTLVYIGRDGTVREFIEGFERGRELAVFSAIEGLVGAVSPEPPKEIVSEPVFDLDISVPICGVYRDGKWYRPLDLDESGRPEAVARARAEGEESLRREAVRLALARLGMTIFAPDRYLECFPGYGMEIRTPQWKKDPLDLLMERLSPPRLFEVVSQETVERERELVLYRRIRIHLNALKDQLDADGYTAERSTLLLRFTRASRLEERAFLEALHTQFPYLSSLEKTDSARGGTEFRIVSQAPPNKVVEKLRGLDVGPPKLSVELIQGGIVEVAMWR